MDNPLYRLIDSRSEQTPHAIALSYGAVRLSYQELQQRSCSLAERLQTVSGEGPVAFLLPHPDEYLIALLAVLRCGLLALPLDSRHSMAKQTHILHDSKASLLIVGSNTPAIAFAGFRLDLTELPEPDGQVYPLCSNHNGAVLSYTTSDLGTLVGRRISQNVLYEWIQFTNQTIKLDLQALFCWTYLDEFGLTLALTSLIQGGHVHFGSEITDLAQAFEHEQIQSLALPLTLLIAWQTTLLEHSNQLRHLITGGSAAFDGSPFREQLKAHGISWHNYVGLPEFMLVTSPRLDAAGASYHVGKSTPFVRAVVLDQTQQLVGVGIPGELYVYGSGVFEGIDQTVPAHEHLFYANPYQAGTQLYRTGYRARWADQGRLELTLERSGFIQTQGGAIALIELERVLRSYPHVRDCAVIAANTTGQAYARSFIVATEPLDLADLEHYLATVLAPATPLLGIILVERLPRTTTGAIDRLTLQTVTALDSRQIAVLEQSLNNQAGLGEVVVVPTLPKSLSLPLHLDDLLPSRTEKPITSAMVVDQQAMVEAIDQPLALVYGKSLDTAEEQPQTLVEALERAANEYATNRLIYYRPNAVPFEQTHAALLLEAERILAGLRACGLTVGRHVLFQLRHNQDFVPAFWACMLGGFIPVPLAVPAQYDYHHESVARLHAAWTLLDAAIISADSERLELETALYAHGGQPMILTIESLRDLAPDSQHHTPQPTDPALFLLTSGSTGVPKGVVLSHQNIITRSKASAQHNGFGSTDIAFNWMPLEHVGGIVMFHIHAICIACSQVLAQTTDILEHPVRWLDVIEQFKVTMTWAPNFAFALINQQHDQVNRVQRDLSSLRFILNGGEAINYQTALAFLRLLKPHGLPTGAIHPAYGMSETSSGITSSHVLNLEEHTGFHELAQSSLQGMLRPATPTDTVVSFVEVGTPLPGVALRIVDQHDQILPVGRVGRLQVAGPTIMAGYYQNPTLNRESFTHDGWFITGDLGFLHDGRLTITGREKDVIIINGLNYNNNEIEALTETIEGIEISFTAACAVRDHTSDTDKVVIFFCSIHTQFERQLEQIAAIRQLLANKLGLAVHYCLPVEKAQIPKTAIGKIQRTQLSQQFAAGAFADLTRKLDLATENDRTLPSWFFQRSWRQVVSDVAPTFTTTPLVILCDDRMLGQHLADVYQQHGRRVVLVTAATTFERQAVDRYTLDCTSKQDYTQLLTSLVADGITAPEYVHLLGYGSYLDAPTTLDTIQTAQTRGVYSILALIQALAIDAAQTVLTVVTARSQMVQPGEPIAYERSTVIGLLKTLALELDWLACRHIDLEGVDSIAEAQLVMAELAMPPLAEVAYRARERFEPQLVRAQFEPKVTQEPFIRGGLYLISGGLGGIGSQLARWLATTYAAKLILLGSSSLPVAHEAIEGLDARATKRLQTYNELQAADIPFVYHAVDIQNPLALATIVKQAETQWDTPLAGIIHLAGAGNLEYHWTVMDQHWATVETTATFDLMFAPKVYGTWALQQLIRDRPEVLFIAGSSVNSFFGGATFSAYSAANSFLDHAMLHQHHHSHPNTTCLNWSMWEQIGMSANNPAHMQAISQARGYRPISVQRGIQSLVVAAAHNMDQLFIGLDSSAPQMRALLAEPFSYTPELTFYTTAPTGSITLDRLHEQISARFGPQMLALRHVPNIPRNSHGKVVLEALLQVAGEMGRETMIGLPTNEREQQLIALWQEVLHHDRIGIYDNFFALGGHSLLATQLASRIRATFQVELRLHQVFAAPTIAQLALVIEQAQLQHIDDAELVQLFTDLDSLSDAELTALLERES